MPGPATVFYLLIAFARARARVILPSPAPASDELRYIEAATRSCLESVPRVRLAVLIVAEHPGCSPSILSEIVPLNLRRPDTLSGDLIITIAR